MTGQLIYQEGEDQVAGGHPFPPFDGQLPDACTHLIFTFKQGKLFFNDLHKFGYIELVTPSQLKTVLERYGIEPRLPNFQLTTFHSFFTSSPAPIKSILLDQRKIACLGNIVDKKSL